MSALNPPVRPEYEHRLEPFTAVPLERTLPWPERLWEQGWLRKGLILIVLAVLWELVARYDHIDGEQWPLTRRELSADAWTLGVNWYAPKHLRVMVDWTDTRRRDELAGRTLDRTGVLAGRIQLDF